MTINGVVGSGTFFESALTFGKSTRVSKIVGETGPVIGNGDGVLFYPGTDKLFPKDSYNVDGPFASLRLKQWRRGIQDHDYLTMAAKVNPEAVEKIVDRVIPKVLWECGVSDPKDPSWLKADISWSTNPDVWEAARRELAQIIADGSKETPAKK